jgi:hypothetical protein
MCLMELGTLISETAGLDAGLLLTSHWAWAHYVVRCFFFSACVLSLLCACSSSDYCLAIVRFR